HPIHDLAPAVFDHLAVADRLGEMHPLRVLCLPMVEAIKLRFPVHILQHKFTPVLGCQLQLSTTLPIAHASTIQRHDRSLSGHVRSVLLGCTPHNIFSACKLSINFHPCP